MTNLHVCRFVTAAFVLVGSMPLVMAQMPNPGIHPDENPVLPGQVELGKALFFEEQIGFDNTVSCATCHINSAGGSDPRAFDTPHPGFDGEFGTADDVFGSAGVVQSDVSGQFVHEGNFFPHVQVTGRKSPPAINAGFFSEIFWDGRASFTFVDPISGNVEIASGGALESQAAGPPLSSVEMTALGQSWQLILDKLEVVKPLALATNIPQEVADFIAANPTYPDMFEAVYGDPTITSRGVLFAIGNYERELIADETELDKLLKHEIEALSPELEAGFDVFKNVAGCTACHTLPFTANSNFHNIGVRPDSEDTGRFAITLDPADMGKFKTPNIRNSSLRLPLFHNGSKATVADVIEFYDRGGDFNSGNLDVNIFPLNLTAQQKADLVHFIEVGLLDPRVVAETGVFTRPTLRSELPPLNTLYGVESLNGSGDPAEVIAHVPANRGHPNWLLGVDDATPSQPAIMALAFEPDPSGTPFPDPRYPVPMNLDLESIFFTTGVSTDAFGVATAKLAIPVTNALAGLHFYAQFFIADPGARATGGLYGTQGVDVEIL